MSRTPRFPSACRPYLSGRFVWPLYTVLVPLTAVSIQSTWASARLERLAEKAFG